MILDLLPHLVWAAVALRALRTVELVARWVVPHDDDLPTDGGS